MKLNDDIKSLRREVGEETNERLAALADPPIFRPFHQANRVISTTLFMLAGPTQKVIAKVLR